MSTKTAYVLVLLSLITMQAWFSFPPQADAEHMIPMLKAMGYLLIMLVAGGAGLLGMMASSLAGKSGPSALGTVGAGFIAATRTAEHAKWAISTLVIVIALLLLVMLTAYAWRYRRK